MINKPRLLTIIGFLLIHLTPLPANPASVVSPDPYADETKEKRNARMAWWREARFGLFIHWGVYSVPAGTHQGKQIPRIGEWIMQVARIPVADYKPYAKEFNPTKYDPTAWAKLAKRAGMRYIVITAKHHDGFALFPSAVTDWDIADASPYGEDLIGPLAEATRAEGLKFGLYYSQAQDWTHPGGAKSRFKEGDGWDDAHKGDFDEYLNQIAVPQVGEILVRYQPDILWWDTKIWMNNERAERLLPLLRIRPGIIHNDRLGGDYKGDTDTPEQHIPATGFKDRDWEVCMTMNNTWGYKSYDHDWKSTEDLIRKLCDIVSKGGNFLLNVGPTAEGEIPAPSIERLETIGKWMGVNAESIYGTTANPFHRLPWGRSTKKVRDDGATLYLQVFDWPDDGKLIVPGLLNLPTSAHLLAGGSALAVEPMAGDVPGIVIHVPAGAPDPYASVVRLEIAGELEIDAVMPTTDRTGRVELTPDFVDLHNPGYGEQISLIPVGGEPAIGNWRDKRAWFGWIFHAEAAGTYRVSVEIAATAEGKLEFGLADAEKRPASLPARDDSQNFQLHELGTLEIPASGVHQIEFRLSDDASQPMRVKHVVLERVTPKTDSG